MSHTLVHILNNDCPHCLEGKVFNEKNIFLNIGFPKMNQYCPHCQFKFEKEPGYFFGAMYVNYGLDSSARNCYLSNCTTIFYRNFRLKNHCYYRCSHCIDGFFQHSSFTIIMDLYV